MLDFGVEDETAWRVGLSCGGRILIYIERLG
jgi:xanthine dehydrogenase accessory factor